MTGALDQQARSALDRFIQQARRLLEADLTREAEGRYGIHAGSGEIEREENLHLDPSGLTARRDLVAVLEFLRLDEGSRANAAGRLIREAAFTHLNRLIAIRIAEAIGLLPQSLSEAASSSGFKELLEVAPLLAHEKSGGYWLYLKICGDELAADLPQLFDPRSPLLGLEPSAPAFEDVVALIRAPELHGVWDAPDALGWAYQFFNSGDERRAMRDESQNPRNSRELAVRNQFFTPRYVVDFLVHNTLGRRLLEASPTPELKAALPLLIDPPTQAGPPIALADVRVLDPSCGSGHFLLGAYDVLETAWAIEGVTPQKAAPHIIASLWGVDIDSRCAQIASAALTFRARRHGASETLPTPNIITARGLPEATPDGHALLSSLPSDRARLVASVRTALQGAPVLGPLLKAEEILSSEIASRVLGADGDTSTLFGQEGLNEDAFGQAEAQVLGVLHRLADSAASDPADRLFAAEAEDAMRFVEAMRNRYDVVLMNPPFGASAEQAEAYLRTAYPLSWTELYAAFVDRAIDLLSPDGYVGALTSSQYLTTKRLAAFRGRLLEENRPLIILDLGAGVLHGATVNTALAVLPKHRSNGLTVYCDLSSASAVARSSAIASGDIAVTRRDLSTFSSIANCPFALHMPDSVVAMWQNSDRLEPSLAAVRTGPKSFDDFRFLRAWWEIPPTRMAEGWRRYPKGGEYCPYVSYSHLLLDWRDDGATLRAYGEETGRLAQVLQSSANWGRPGLCYPRVSSIGFAARALPAGEIFGEKSIAILPNADVPVNLLMALLNSTAAAEMLQIFGRGRATENGAVKSLPFGREFLLGLSRIDQTASDLISLFDAEGASSESSCTFEFPAMAKLARKDAGSWISGRRSRAEELQRTVDIAVAEALGVRRMDPLTADRTALIKRAFPEVENAELLWAEDITSYLVGLAFGRWDVRLAAANSGIRGRGDVYQELPNFPPGMLCGSGGQHPIEQPDGYPLQLPLSNALIDEPQHQWDIEDSVVRAAQFLYKDACESVLADVLQMIGESSLRAHFRGSFFRSHLKRYSKSRRKAPIYWPLTVPSGKWGIWIYAPAISRETLYLIAAEAKRRWEYSEAEIDRLEREKADGHSPRGGKELARILDAERRLAEELRQFRQEADRIAGLGWDPDLTDGIGLCAAPMASLFPMWRDCAQYRDELRNGQHSWAHVSEWAEEL